MKILQALWRYWTWLCVALLTTFALLFLLATILTHFKSAAPEDAIAACIEGGGAWDADSGACIHAG